MLTRHRSPVASTVVRGDPPVCHLHLSVNSTMKLPTLIATLFAILLASTHAFVPSTGRMAPSPSRITNTALNMGGKQSKFGVFSPAVYGAKLVLGTDKLNKIRGKAISLHSQYIGDFCEWVGAYHLRTKLIKKAKVNGDTLGFLV